MTVLYTSVGCNLQLHIWWCVGLYCRASTLIWWITTQGCSRTLKVQLHGIILKSRSTQY